MKKKFIAVGAIAAMMTVSGQVLDFNHQYVGISHVEAGIGVGGVAKVAAGDPKKNYANAVTNLAKATVYMIVAQQQIENIDGEELKDYSSFNEIANEITGGNREIAKEYIETFNGKSADLVKIYKTADRNNANVKANLQNIANLRAASRSANKAALGDAAKLIASGGTDGVAALIASAKEIKAMLDLQNEAHKAMKEIDDLEKKDKIKADVKKVPDLQMEAPAIPGAEEE